MSRDRPGGLAAPPKADVTCLCVVAEYAAKRKQAQEKIIANLDELKNDEIILWLIKAQSVLFILSKHKKTH